MPSLKIERIKPTAVLAPLVRPVTTAVGSIPKAPLILIDIECSGGIVGRSYLFTYTPLVLSPLARLIENMAETLVGKSVEPVARMREFEAQFLLLGRQGLVTMAIAGLDMALWDAAAKQQDLTVAQLLGAGNAPLACYDSHGIFEPSRDVKAIEASLAKGFTALKFKIGGGTLQDDLERLRQIRAITGDKIRLMVDYNQSLTTPEAVYRITRLEYEFDLDWVEEPVRAEDFEGHARVRAKVKTAIQTGENWWLPDDAARAIQAGISDHAMLDIMKIGGVTGWLRAAGMAQSASMPISSHTFIEASANVMAATAGAYLVEHMDVASTILAEPFEVRDGTVSPQGVGLGLDWDQQAVKRYAA